MPATPIVHRVRSFVWMLVEACILQKAVLSLTNQTNLAAPVPLMNMHTLPLGPNPTIKCTNPSHPSPPAFPPLILPCLGLLTREPLACSGCLFTLSRLAALAASMQYAGDECRTPPLGPCCCADCTVTVAALGQLYMRASSPNAP